MRGEYLGDLRLVLGSLGLADLALWCGLLCAGPGNRLPLLEWGRQFVELGAVLFATFLLAGTVWVICRQYRCYVRDLAATDAKAKASENVFAALALASSDGIMLCDAAGKISFANRAATALFGYAADELVGQGLGVLLAPPQFRLKYASACPEGEGYGCRCLEGGVSEIEAWTKDGRVLRVELSMASIDNGEGRHSLAIVRDITAKKQLEQEVRDSERKFRTLFYACPDAAAIFELETGTLSMVNRGFAQLFGYVEDEVRGKTPGELGLWEAGAIRSRFAADAKPGVLRTFELPFTPRDGSQRIGAVSAGVVAFHGTRYCTLILRDVTQDRAEAQAYKASCDSLSQAIEIVTKSMLDSAKAVNVYGG